jgi:hypothetical protein
MMQTRETIVGAIKSTKGDAFPGLLLDSLAIHSRTGTGTGDGIEHMTRSQRTIVAP